MIDADPQANATSGLGIDVDAVEQGTYQLLEHSVSAVETIITDRLPQSRPDSRTHRPGRRRNRTSGQRWAGV